MTVRDFRDAAVRRLTVSGSPDPLADAEWLLCDALDAGRAELRFRMDEPLTANQFKCLEGWLARRESGEPLQYIEGFAEFMGLRFFVDPRVLIPRQDTETLCEHAFRTLRGMERPDVLDLCTGSGALALTIAKRFPAARVVATDISADALDVARANAEALGVIVEFVEGDLFDSVRERRFDLIVCNPPYLSRQDMRTLQREVKREPALALNGGSDGLGFYRRMVPDVKAYLKPGGSIFFEVGEGQSEVVRAMLQAAMPDAVTGVHHDLRGKERVVWARLGPARD